MDKQALEDIKRRIVGKKISKIDGGLCGDSGPVLLLDDGTEVSLFEDVQYCCAGAYGNWKILDAENLEAGITDIEFEQTADSEEDGDSYFSSAVITILHNQNPLATAECYADAGNGGFYFSSLSLRIELPDGGEYDTGVIGA